MQGIIKAIIFHSEENSFTILKLKVTDTDETNNLFFEDDYQTVTGYFPRPMRGDEIKFYGEFKEHPKYGLQYQVSSLEKIGDTSITGLIDYLSSDLFSGVGIKTATRIVNKLGKDTIKSIMDDPSVLDSIKKLSSTQKQTIKEGLFDNKATENILIKLYSYNISPKMAMRIYKFYQNETIAIIEKNPYQLIYDIDGIGFDRADKIAKNMGIKEDDPLRIKAMIVYLYNLMGTKYGHTFLYLDQLQNLLLNAINKTEQRITEDELNTFINELIEEGHFVKQADKIFLTSVKYAETSIAEKINELLAHESKSFSTKAIYKHIELYEEIHEITYTKTQKKAIEKAIKHNLFILTGGPGTGKTTVIKGIVYVYSKLHQLSIRYNDPLFDIKLIAPTGRAAKRMTETTNLYAETIHRFLGYNYDGKFTHNKDNLINADVVIVDEASMIDIFLASQLFQSLPKTTKVIIVGDENQLPSVGPGLVLKNLLSSEFIDYVKLEKIHRQAEGSNIIDLAFSINDSQIPEDIETVYDDRLFVKETKYHFQDRLLSSIHYLLNQGYSLTEDIQVLIPMYRGETGIDATNKNIQEEFNPNKEKSITHGERLFRIGDKVIQLTNQIEDNIMNGDQGSVIGIKDESTLIVDFDGNEVSYKKGDLIHLKHAYAMSIHKSQGNEYKVVILPIFKSYSIMLKRKLLYTAVTRAKEKLILIGDLDAFKYGVKRIDDPRQTMLNSKIKSVVLKEEVTQKDTSETQRKQIKDPTIPFDTLGEEIAEGITPYSFLND